MSFTGEQGHYASDKNSFEEFADEGFTKEEVGQPVLLRRSRGYYVSEPGTGDSGYGYISEDSDGTEGFSLRGVLLEREYSLGIIASRDVLHQKRGLIIPVDGFVSWQAAGEHLDPETSAFARKDPPLGIEWISASLAGGKGNAIQASPIVDAKNPEGKRLLGTRVVIKDKALDLVAGPSHPGGRLERFAAIDIAVGQILTEELLNSDEREDKLLARILEGDAAALIEAIDPEVKQKAAKVAIRAAKAKARADAEADDGLGWMGIDL